MPANLENSAVATGLEKISFHSNPKKGNAKECSNYQTIALISHASKFSSVQSLSCVRLFATPWIAAHQAFLSITNSRSSLRLTSIESVMPSSHLILCHPLFLRPPIPPSIGVFSNESTLRMRWPEYWSFSFSILPSKEHPGLISFGLAGSPCSPRDAQESSPTPMFTVLNRSITQKNKYCQILFIQGTQSKQIHRDIKQNGSGQRQGAERRGGNGELWLNW